MIHLSVTIYCNWPTNHAIDDCLIWLKRLAIQVVFNEVSQVTFSKKTHGFGVTIPKNYLKQIDGYVTFYNRQLFQCRQ